MQHVATFSGLLQLPRLCRACGFALIWFLVPLSCAWPQEAVEFQNIKLTQLGTDLALSGQVKFELPAAIEEAMRKGVTLTFVSSVDMTRERWYWWDKEVARQTRQIRISYQALTRRWRVTPWRTISTTSPDTPTSTGQGVQLAQTYDTLGEALQVAQRITNWRLVSLGKMGSSDHTLTLLYRLDISQLPKPLQIGLLGQGEAWAIRASLRLRINQGEL